MTDIAQTSLAERIARVIAAVPLSPNAEGPPGADRAVADAVDDNWRDEIDRAGAVMRTLREPTPAMVAAGAAAGDDPAEIWSAMVRAAINEPANGRGFTL